MNQILSFAEVLQYLSIGEVVFIKEDTHFTYFKKLDQKIIVKSDNYVVKLSIDEWKDLYQNRSFFLFEDKSEDFIDPEKDKEYYSWRHK